VIPGGCRICGGTAGDDRQVAHSLCMTRVDLGEPTPSLGNACPCCGGSGNHPNAELASINGGQDAIERHWAPACRTCSGSGAIDVEDSGAATARMEHAKTILHWFGGCR